MGEQFTDAMLTFFKEPNIKGIEDKVQYFICQEEICPSSGRHHWQGYVELKTKRNISGIKKIFKDQNLHIEKRRGPQEACIKYCSKQETRKEGAPIIFIGTPRIHQQGRRTDLDELFNYMCEGHTMKEIYKEYRGMAMKFSRHIDRTQEVLWGDESHIDKLILLMRETNISAGGDGNLKDFNE